MPLESSTQISLTSIEDEDARLGPLALLVDDADDLGRPSHGEIVDGQPRTDFDGRSVDDLADLGDRQSLVLDRPGRQALAAPQIERRDILHVHAELQHSLDGREIVVDCFVGEPGLLHVLFEELQVFDADIPGPVIGIHVQESLQMLAVVRPDEQSFVAAPHLLGRDELLAQRQNGDPLGWQDGHRCGSVGSPLPPDLDGLDVLLQGLIGVSAEIMSLAAPFRDVSAVCDLDERGGSDVHVGVSLAHGCPRRQTWVPSTLRNSLSTISPSRTRTYDLAVNSRFSSCIFGLISEIMSVLGTFIGWQTTLPAERRPTLPLGRGWRCRGWTQGEPMSKEKFKRCDAAECKRWPRFTRWLTSPRAVARRPGDKSPPAPCTGQAERLCHRHASQRSESQ